MHIDANILSINMYVFVCMLYKYLHEKCRRNTKLENGRQDIHIYIMILKVNIINKIVGYFFFFFL